MPKKRKKTQIDEIIEHVGEEVEAIGKKMEKKGYKCGAWYRNAFGVAGPFLSAVASILLFFAVLWVMNYFTLRFECDALLAIQGVLYSNIGLFFIIYLFMFFKIRR